ncbi:MAG TPA: integrase [Mycobacterium sp.]|nr:integrase [Mycobacterium sp.]
MNCAHCDTPLPGWSRRDRLYCNNKCRALASYYRQQGGISTPPRWQHPAIGSGDPVLRAAARRTQELGEAHAWDPSTTSGVLDGLVTVLDGRAAGERVPITEVRSRTHRKVPKARLVEVLADLDLLDDDATPAIRAWIDRCCDELPSGFAEPVRAWLLVLLNGNTRARPRSPQTLYRYFGAARPILKHLAEQRDHLREVTATDIYAALDQLRGKPRNNAIGALRSLFGFAKKRGFVFADPTTGLKANRIDANLLPMTDTEIRDVEQIATGPAQRLIVALAAEHAARTGAIRQLMLDDLDLPNRRITIAGHRQRLGDLTHRALRAWLDHRRNTWPRTPNRHVLITGKTSVGTGPVSEPYVREWLGNNGFTVDRIRADRILHEALTAGPDPLHLSLVFNISHDTASRYTTIAEHLLADEEEQPPEQ